MISTTPQVEATSEPKDVACVVPNDHLLSREQVESLVHVHREGALLSPEQEGWLAQLPPERHDEVRFLVQREAQHQQVSVASTRKKRLRRYALLTSSIAMALWLFLSQQPQQLWVAMDAFVKVLTWDVDGNTSWATKAYIIRHYDGAIREHALFSCLLRSSHGETHKKAPLLIDEILHKFAQDIKDRPIDALWRHPQLKSRFWGSLPPDYLGALNSFDSSPLSKALRRARSLHVRYALARALNRGSLLSWDDALWLYQKSQHPKLRQIGLQRMVRALEEQVKEAHWNFLPSFRMLMSLPSAEARRDAAMSLLAYATPFAISVKGPFFLDALRIMLVGKDQQIRRKAMSWLRKKRREFSLSRVTALLIPITLSQDPELRRGSRQLLLQIAPGFWWAQLPQQHPWRRACPKGQRTSSKKRWSACVKRLAKSMAARR